MKYGVIHLKDVFPFLGENDCDPTLTYYLADNLTEMKRNEERHPCMVICPGGGYAMCSQREAEPIAFQFLPLGFHAFVLNYSVNPKRFPTQIREVAAAFELICQKADEWHCNTDRIGVMGFSAGGHLAAHYSNAYNCPEVREVFPESKRPFASVLGYPVITPDPRYAHLGSFHSLVGFPLPEDVAERFGCDSLVSDDTPPAFLWHTSEDTCVPVVNSLLYAKALWEHKIPYELHIYPKGCHGLSTCDHLTCDSDSPELRHDAQWLDSMKKWIALTF